MSARGKSTTRQEKVQEMTGHERVQEMRAAVISEIGGQFTTETVRLAEPIGREVLVDVKASGLCHTDLSIAHSGFGATFPAVLGHEVSGVVAAIGPDVDDLAIGDHVVACLVQACGACVACLGGRSFQCGHPERTLRKPDEAARISTATHNLDQLFGIGGFAQRVVVHENQLVRIDSRVPFAQAALLGCGVVTGAGVVVNSANTQPGDTVLIVGVGGVGLNAINGAVAAGASKIIAIDISDGKLEKARKFGATHVFNSATDDVVSEVLSLTQGGVDSAFDFVGTQSATRSALEMLRVGGALYLIGSVDPTAALTISNLELILSQKRIQGVFMGSSTAKRDIPRWADLYLQGRFELDGLVSREISLDEVTEGYGMLKDPDVARVVITSGLS